MATKSNGRPYKTTPEHRRAEKRFRDKRRLEQLLRDGLPEPPAPKPRIYKTTQADRDRFARHNTRCERLAVCRICGEPLGENNWQINCRRCAREQVCRVTARRYFMKDFT